MRNIDLYLVSGFLGSGKTTFLRNLLSQEHNAKVGIIVNEFGSIGIDGKLLTSAGLKMTEVTGGSIFCACLKADFVKALIEFLSFDIDALFVEASGMADPFGMENLLVELENILSKRDGVTARYAYKGSVCLVDAVNFIDHNDIFVSVGKQIQKSGLVILNKTDMVTEAEQEEICEIITEINSNAYIAKTTYGQIPFEMFAERLNPSDSLNAESSNRCDNRPASYILNMRDLYGIDDIKAFLTEISARAVRMKGFFRSNDKKTALADCAGSMIKVTEHPDADYTDPLSIVIIGGDTEPFEDMIKTAWERFFPGKGFDCVYDS